MSRNGYNFLDCGIEEEIDPKVKFNSLISATVSTVMCLAAKCPLPKSNVETTRLFLSTITDDNGETPRNIKGFLTLLNNYSGPYESDSCKEEKLDKPLTERNPQEKKESKASAECDPAIKRSTSTAQMMSKESGPLAEVQTPAKRALKAPMKKTDKEPTKKTVKNLTSKISTSKSVISKF